MPASEYQCWAEFNNADNKGYSYCDGYYPVKLKASDLFY